MAQKDQIIYMYNEKQLGRALGGYFLIAPLSLHIQNGVTTVQVSPHVGATTEQGNCHYVTNLCQLYLCLGPTQMDILSRTYPETYSRGHIRGTFSREKSLGTYPWYITPVIFGFGVFTQYLSDIPLLLFRMVTLLSIAPCCSILVTRSRSNSTTLLALFFMMLILCLKTIIIIMVVLLHHDTCLLRLISLDTGKTTQF